MLAVSTHVLLSLAPSHADGILLGEPPHIWCSHHLYLMYLIFHYFLD
ncbi:hypothetical protein AAZV13_03G213000 [Glycine max]